MDTLHKLAGVDQPSAIPEPPPVPQDTQPYLQESNSNRTSRASLPLNRRPSKKSIRSTKSGKSHRGAPADYPAPPLPGAQQRTSQESANSDEEEFAWGPSHPCFPHPNPHCAPDSEEYQTTRVIRVRRDWLQAGDLYPQYANLYPEILDPQITDDEFRFLISNLNGRLKTMFSPYSTRAWVDAVMGVATGYFWDDMGLTGPKKGMKSLERFVDEWNRRAQAEGREVRMVQLRKTGFMALDFVIPDPGIDVAGDEEETEEGGIGPAE